MPCQGLVCEKQEFLPVMSCLPAMLTFLVSHLQSYIDFEINDGQRGRTRALYERLLDRTRHVKVWISFAEFEAAALPQPEEQEADGLQNGAARSAEGEAPAAREAHARR